MVGGSLWSLSTDEVTDEGTAQLLEGVDGRSRQLVEPLLGRSLKCSGKGAAYDFVRGLLKAQSRLERVQVI